MIDYLKEDWRHDYAVQCNWKPYAEAEQRELDAWTEVQRTQSKPDNWQRHAQDGCIAHLRHVVFYSETGPLAGYDTLDGPFRYRSGLKSYWWTDYFHITLPPAMDRIFISSGRYTLADALARADEWAESHGGWE